MYHYRLVRVSICAIVSLWVGLAAHSAFGADEKLLVFGRVQDNPVRAIKDRQEFVDYIAKKLAPLGFTGGKVLVVDKVGQLAQAAKEGKVDLFHDSVAATMVMSRWSGAVPILRQWKYKEAEYYSVILVKKDSGVDTLSGLKGKVLAFDEPHSTSAHILPRMLLTENKFKLVQVVTPGKVESDAIGYIHGSDDNAINLLFQALRPEIQDGIKIAAKSISVPRQIISVRKDLDPKIVAAVKELLISMDKNPEGQGVLTRQQGTTNIDAIPPASHERMRVVEKFIFSSLGKQVESW
jgi:phosphonate transport system substrate-binding protein